LGRRETYSTDERMIPYEPWMSRVLEPLPVTMPDKPVLAVLTMILEDRTGVVLHRNFTTYLVSEGRSPREEDIQTGGGRVRLVRFAPDSYHKAEWSQSQWNVLEGLKVNGAGSGYFEYRIGWPSGLQAADIAEASLRIELSSKQLFGKDRRDAGSLEGDYMRGEGAHDNSLNPNAYPMSDAVTYPSAVRIRLGGQVAGVFDLADDAADHRGILSWFSQQPGAERRTARLHEAGSYGQLIEAHLPRSGLLLAQEKGELVIRLEVDAALPGGLAIYGERFGRYPLDPTLAFALK
jgi:hypothetical protein